MRRYGALTALALALALGAYTYGVHLRVERAAEDAAWLRTEIAAEQRESLRLADEALAAQAAAEAAAWAAEERHDARMEAVTDALSRYGSVAWRDGVLVFAPNRGTPRARTSRVAPSVGALSRAEVAAKIRYWADAYEVAAVDWLVAKGSDIAYRESGYNPSAQNPTSSAAGLFQFLKAWGPLESRLDPDWSARRFVQVYMDGGDAALRKHWATTY